MAPTAEELCATDHPRNASIPVETVRLGDTINRLSHVDLLKLDIEGTELEHLSETEHRLGRVARIVVEYHCFTSEDQSLDDLLKLLRRKSSSTT
jgi:FkbM family methyltransferase